MTCKGICQQYKATKPVTGGRYGQNGQKRCQICEIFIKHDGIWCPCCGYRLRQRPRNLQYKDKFKLLDKDNPKESKEFLNTGFIHNGKPVLILEKYLDSIPRPNDSQRKALRESIRNEGLHEPIIINQDNIVLDGHTRIEICQELHIKPKFLVRSFENSDLEKIYVVTVNLKRRHLNDFQIIDLLEDELVKIRQKKKEEGYASNNGCKPKKGVKKGDLPRNERSPFFEIGKELGVSPVRIEDIIRIKKFGDKRLIHDVRLGKTSVTDAVYRIRKIEARKPRYNFKAKLLPATEPSPFRFCPVCGTETLERFYSVAEKHCTKCDYYYTLKRRLHKG